MTMEQPSFLPLSIKEAHRLGIDRPDFLIVTGDAYVDHPSFAAALLGRVLWDAGFSVGIISQPDWRTDRDLLTFGPPELGILVAPGNVDSMVNHYTANLKRRNRDVYTAGGHPGKRPDRAAIVYTDRLHAVFPGVPVILGGIEASLRRFAHYDYWSDRVRQSILADAPADLLVFGMGERQVVEIGERLAAGEAAGEIRNIPGTAYRVAINEWKRQIDENIVTIPDFQQVSGDKREYARAFALHYQEQDPFRGRSVAQVHPKTVVIQNPPARPLSTSGLDHLYELPYTRAAHPASREPVPALEPVKFSVTSHRGCFGECAFCALTHHQGRIIQSRSVESLEREVRRIAKLPGFSGVITDVGGPTANMWGARCSRWETAGTCPDRHCSPACGGLVLSHQAQMELLAKLREVPGVRWVFIGSGIRFDLVMADPAPYLEELCRHHVSGHLKVAPEHVSERVLELMNKPDRAVFDRFRARFSAIGSSGKKKQYLLPYFMSGHPGCTIEDMIELAEYIRDHRLYTEQVQDFTPTPMSPSTCMYYTGINPFTMKEVHIPRGREKKIQRAILHYREPANRALVEEGLRGAGREDLIGPGADCLIPGTAKIRRSTSKTAKK
ncbi:putative radical SAM protein YgiQ [Methanolinea mesophila]|uniref:YgiQ family radical SAM protein n=1 Tax=Methanolinea mesophila TaxID=547055 RepID=UPI001AE0E9FC|nr:YgiQ family radical SAM protein [Methanolinea mesophila]MBP1928777.1 putative radical SAM protein YgiQ [Methanolinea mesophila]